MREVTLYTRPGCGLCEQVKEQIETLRSKATFHLGEVNIDADPALRERYNEHVPVVAVDGEEVCRHRFDQKAFLRRFH